MKKHIHTVRGPIESGSIGRILPHEHLFTDLRGPSAAGYAQGDPSAVVKVVGPHLAKAAATGVTAGVTVHCGGGIVRAVAVRAG